MRVSTGEVISSFDVPGALNTDTAQMEITAYGRRVFLRTSVPTFAFNTPIRAFDVQTGVEVAASQPVYLRSFDNRFVVDEARNLLLTPHYNFEAPFAVQLFALDAATLALLGEGNPGGYRPSGITFQPIRGRGTVAAYVLRASGDQPARTCDVSLDAFDGTGAVRTHARLSPLENFPCGVAVALLSAPDAPSGLTVNVAGRRVTLTWSNPGETTAFELEAGIAPGRRDLAARIDLVTGVTVDDVPPGVYYVRVRAINEIGVSPVSNEVRVVVP